jgi:phosphatidylglycerophosphatase A
MTTLFETVTPPAPDPDATPAPPAKPRFSLFIATAAGLGYLPKAPGTWGSLAGVLIYALVSFCFPLSVVPGVRETYGMRLAWAAWTTVPIAILIAGIGVWTSSHAASYSGKKDPQFVVIDEVSGQFLTYLLALAPFNWKYLLLGFILFRLFDIWKPFPARQAESLPGGWGIMADDWIAGLYAALGLWIARAAGF